MEYCCDVLRSTSKNLEVSKYFRVLRTILCPITPKEGLTHIYSIYTLLIIANRVTFDACSPSLFLVVLKKRECHMYRGYGMYIYVSKPSVPMQPAHRSSVNPKMSRRTTCHAHTENTRHVFRHFVDCTQKMQRGEEVDYL